MEQSFIFPILKHPLTWGIARVLGTFMFWYAGICALLDFPTTVSELRAEGFLINPSSIAAAVIAVQLIGSALVIQGHYAWLGTGMLALFTLFTQPLVQDLWRYDGIGALQVKLANEGQLTVIGGLIGLSILSYMLERQHGNLDEEAKERR